MSVMAYLLEAVEEQARLSGAAKVLAINLVIGERAGLVDDSLMFYFEMMTPGTRVEGARLNVRRTRLGFHCESCGRDYKRTGDDFRCPECGAVGQVLSDGSELMIESMEIER
ncbi:MAG: hydrogenase maturation nickel metallochaperone HypA [Chloroflexia bacterium]